MRLSYNRIAGQSVERLAALSDGIFAVAMTLLVLDLHTPARQAIHSERDLCVALGAMGPQLVTWLMSFLTLTIFWNGQQAEMHRFARADRHVTWMSVAFLMRDFRAAVFNPAAGGVHRLPHRFALLLGEHRCARLLAVRHLAVRLPLRAGERRRDLRRTVRH